MEDKIIGLTHEQFQSRKEMCKTFITKAEALARLENNVDFKSLIQDAYLEEEAIRLVHLLGEQTFNMATLNKDGSGMSKAAYREDIQERMIGIARLDEYFRNVYKAANQAKNELEGLAQAEAEYFDNNTVQ